MNLLQSSPQFSTVRFLHLHPSSPTPLRTRFLPVRSSLLPFTNQNAKYHRELEAAVDVVERACRICVDLKKSLCSGEGRIVEKNDNTPVTVADFGVQALVSLELSKMFPSIPLVAEEDSDFVRSNNLVDSVVSVVTDKASFNDKPLANADVLEAIDRGGKNAIVYGTRPATYWVLDPIDGTKGFLKGSEALYVVGLALVVEGDIVLGVMGCPNWKEASSYNSNIDVQGSESVPSRSGILMVAHVGCGTWARQLSDLMGVSAKVPNGWTRCFVDGCHLVPKARFCISDSQTWESVPLSAFFSATSDADGVSDKQILLLPTCCGSLCKYLMVASGRASVFILRARAQTIIKAWDHAVGIICVHEAGGKVTDWKGRDIDLAADQVERRILFPSLGVLVTNGTIHNQILEMISSTS
ncbi:PREDICTED: putative PAP-specific phosphatase, mitochondrial [Populus euphratica]|uniref:PAP-specific phosphatase, mitochondrial n=1 Tax=Populus euphratica TaxID=75702 RepID=A0AAJ6SY47_POPEU|nr:PREDICTED: putative PAP-specific phosphatase, mitochondrial [Populus euphratica]XP_011001148.1 PREDICTED: putative PAP-specific phosphatase, mitochondrial [Populus euphratica]XP_011001149.1 PREDICTED: putative PAP-specific phosphatase, mitochondrial [Populus euphratica]XP_011001150.1 PREDICTED: putative PAP-specific phosphatase, mitochondrial [Populus euphratica]